jgi:triosephosphate isomerase
VYHLLHQEVVVAPPSLYILGLKEAIRKDIQVAAQNAYCEKKGAFTGEIRLVNFKRISVSLS